MSEASGDERFTASMTGWTTGRAGDWLNTITVTVTTGWTPIDGGARPGDDDPAESACWYADAGGERRLVQVDTNYKSGRPGPHPVQLTRTNAVALAWYVLAAVEETFDRSRYGALRAGEALELLRALPELDFTLAELRAHAVEDLAADIAAGITDDTVVYEAGCESCADAGGGAGEGGPVVEGGR